MQGEFFATASSGAAGNSLLIAVVLYSARTARTKTNRLMIPGSPKLMCPTDAGVRARCCRLHTSCVELISPRASGSGLSRTNHAKAQRRGGGHGVPRACVRKVRTRLPVSQPARSAGPGDAPGRSPFSGSGSSRLCVRSLLRTSPRAIALVAGCRPRSPQSCNSRGKAVVGVGCTVKV
jgi:hypothetical protein